MFVIRLSERYSEHGNYVGYTRVRIKRGGRLAWVEIPSAYRRNFLGRDEGCFDRGKAYSNYCACGNPLEVKGVSRKPLCRVSGGWWISRAGLSRIRREWLSPRIIRNGLPTPVRFSFFFFVVVKHGTLRWFEWPRSQVLLETRARAERRRKWKRMPSFRGKKTKERSVESKSEGGLLQIFMKKLGNRFYFFFELNKFTLATLDNFSKSWSTRI